MDEIAENLWLMRFPLALLGVEIGRQVTLIQLETGDLVIHSTGPFTPADVTSIRALGTPRWLIEATLFHDTFTHIGRASFPEIPLLAPPGFPSRNEEMVPLSEPPADWRDELDVQAIGGMPRVREHVLLHRPTRTLIAADLLFNFGQGSPARTRAFFRWIGGIREYPGMSRLFRASIRDRQAFGASMKRIMQWDFDRMIVGHGDVIERGAKRKLAQALARAGLGFAEFAQVGDRA